MCDKVGFPQGVVNVILGNGEIGNELVENSLVRMISFTGSTKVGKLIGGKCAKRLIPCSLELGGKNSCILFADADLEESIRIIVDGAFCKNFSK